MRRQLFPGLIAAAMLIPIVPAPAIAQTYTLVATLSGDQETPVIVTGAFGAAEKSQVQAMVQRLLGLSDTPPPSAPKPEKR